MEAILQATPGIDHVIMFNGFSFVANTQEPNGAIAFVFLEPWEKRTTPDTQIEAIMTSVATEAERVPAASVLTINPPVVHGISSIGGFDFELQDYTGTSMNDLEKGGAGPGRESGRTAGNRQRLQQPGQQFAPVP